MGNNSGLVRVQNLTNQAVIADRVYVAECFFDRLRGLIGKNLENGMGMLFPKNNSIHMWFMSFPIDVVFIRKEKSADGKIIFKVSSVHENVRPWRPHPLMDWRASETLELPNGTVRRCAITAGDELCIS